MSEDAQFSLAIVEWNYGIESDCQLSIDCVGKRFEVVLSPSTSSEETVEGSLLKKLDAVLSLKDYDEEMKILHEMGDVVCETGLPTFELLAPPVKSSLMPNDLDSLLHPETFFFQLVTVDGRVQLTKREDGILDVQISALNILDSTLPKFYLKDIKVLKSFRNNNITKVLVDGQERCCKVANRPTVQAVQREFDCLSKVSSAELNSRVRVPRIVGLVMSKTGMVVGILEEFICSNPSTKQPTLRGIDINTVTEARRAKWASQVREVVEVLHGIGVIWGDGKADNVLVDVNDDAWLIDFGGGWTEKWVDEKLAGTVEGDKQAVEKIAKFLGVYKQNTS